MNKQTVYLPTIEDFGLKVTAKTNDGKRMFNDVSVKKLESVYVFTEEEFTRLKSATEALAEILEIPQIKELARHIKSTEPYRPIVEAVKKICQPVVPLTEDKIDAILTHYVPHRTQNGPVMYNHQQILGMIKEVSNHYKK